MRGHLILLLLAGAATPLAAQVKACSLLTRAEAAQILNKPAVAKAQVISADDEDCGYLGAGFDIHTEIIPSVSGWSQTVKNQIKQGKAESASEGSAAQLKPLLVKLVAAAVAKVP